MGQLPQSGKQTARRTLLQCDPSGTIFQDQHGHFHNLPGGFRLFLRQFRDPPFPQRRTNRRDRTPLAQRCAVWQADRGAKLHQTLGEIAAPFRRIDRFQTGFEVGTAEGIIAALPRDPGKNPHHVAVHRRFRLAERNGKDRTRRVVPDPGKGAERLKGIGEAPAVFLHDRPGGFRHIPHPAVITQPLP